MNEQKDDLAQRIRAVCKDWKFDDFTVGGNFAIIHGNWGEICRVSPMQDTRIRDAVATLIAAAPALRAALEELANDPHVNGTIGEPCACFPKVKRLLETLQNQMHPSIQTQPLNP